MLIGLTGGIASGRSTVGRIFKKLGAEIIDSDSLSREVVKPRQPAWKKIVAFFGKDILEQDKKIDRKKLASLIFSDSSLRKRLEEIVHPEIIKARKKIVRDLFRKDPASLVIIDAALLIEAGTYQEVDCLLVVYCEPEIQLKRLIKRDKFSQTEALKRIKAQLPLKKKLAYADFIIDNNSSLKKTQRQVKALYKMLTRKNKEEIIGIASDHGGYELKKKIINYLAAKKIICVDFGSGDNQSVDYPDYGVKVVRALKQGKIERGILLCGTGLGMSILANRFPGIRGTLCHDLYSARMSREHNNSNILILGARVMSGSLSLKIVDCWLESKFLRGRHERRLKKIEELGGKTNCRQ